MRRALTLGLTAAALLAPVSAAEAHTLSAAAANAKAMSVARELYLGIPDAVDYAGGDCYALSAHARSCTTYTKFSNGIICRSRLRVEFVSSTSYALDFAFVGDPVCA